MKFIRTVLQKSDHLRGKELPPRKLEFEHFWAIGLFTSDGDFCGQFQRDLRRADCGCKWRHMEKAFYTAIHSLSFVQKMGVWSGIEYSIPKYLV